MLMQLPAQLTAKQHYAFEVAGGMAWHLMADQSAIFVLMTKADYPQRYAADCLSELCRTVMAKCQDKLGTSKSGGLSSNCSQLLSKLCSKFDDINKVSKLHNVMAQVDAVKLQMEQNIQDALANTASLEDIENKAEELKDQSIIFKSNAKQLKDKMWWKNLKMWLLVVGLFLLIAGIVGVIIAAESGAFEKKKKNKDDD
jgi:thiosulfate reductase cytochrome b subunit